MVKTTTRSECCRKAGHREFLFPDTYSGVQVRHSTMSKKNNAHILINISWLKGASGWVPGGCQQGDSQDAATLLNRVNSVCVLVFTYMCICT